ncbi:MAG TPA: Maf family nucleotide pyrophosphatase [Bacteroidales bacterium]|nr:Maf family nucleotide pyrophosphatase [Bacteroidales bacterium]
MIEKIKNYHVVLASSSPRRQQLLKDMGINFDVAKREYDESYPRNLPGAEIALYISRRKASLFKDYVRENEIVITADTIVWCNNKVIGKPVSVEEAISMLKQISGNVHEVITGVTILSGKKEISFSDSTKVKFEVMSDDEIRYYAENFNPMDKAGAYGIQEWIGIIGCSTIEGSYFNVVGLPVQKLYQELKKIINQDS